MRIGSLFTGTGGLDTAVTAAFGMGFGETTAWVSDIDSGACKVLAHHYPDVPNLGDITAVDWSTVEPVDIITGGSPCQDLSHAGRRAGMTDGTRSNLWVSMREAIAIIRPTYVIWENVRGAYSAAADSEVEPCPGCVGDGSGVHLRALGRVLGDLSDLGYDTQWRGLRAADVGAPHGRFRVFVVARLADTEGDQGRLQHRDGSAFADAGRLRGQQGWEPTTGEETGGRSLAVSGISDRAPVALLPTPAAQEPGGSAEQYHERLRDHDGRESSFLPLGMAVELMPTPSVADATGGRFGQYAPAIARWEHAIGRPAPSPTEPTGRGGAHRLSPRFVEWMMGCPNGWFTDVPGVTRNEALRLGGNGVVPQQAYGAIVDSLKNFDRLEAA